MESISSFQIAASCGITLGFCINWFRPNWIDGKRSPVPAKALVFFVLGIFALFTCISFTSVPQTIFMFFVMNFAYETVWLFYSSQFFRASPKEATGRFQFVMHSSSSCLMAGTTLAYSIFIHVFGLQDSFLWLLALVGIIFGLAQAFALRVQKQVSLG